MDGLGDEQTLWAKARAAGPPSKKDSLFSTGNFPRSGSTLSWREAARSIKISPSDSYPKIHELERSVLPSIRTLRAQFVCSLCPYCKRPMIESLVPRHVRECEQRLSAQQPNDDEKVKLESDAGSSGKINGSKIEENGAASNKKKRKLGESNGTVENETISAPKRNKTTAKAKTQKTSKTSKQIKPAKTSKSKQAKQSKEKNTAVYHPDKNCGVPLPSSQPCMRSLTCKQHSMGAKRSVPGRSAPYDILLGNYHRQHQMKQAQLSASAAHAAQLESDQLQEVQTQQNPEREVHQVLEGVSRVFCAPLATGKVFSSSTRATNFRLREMLASALLPRRLPPTGDVLYGRSLAYNQNTPDRLVYVRSQAVQQALYVSQLQQRQMQLRRQAEANSTNVQSATAMTPQQEQMQQQRLRQSQPKNGEQ